MESYNLIVQAINKALKSGTFDLNEIQAILEALKVLQDKLNDEEK